MWIIGNNGQGDSWFLFFEKIYFYDHNDGDYIIENFQSLGIDFIKFIEICKIIKKYEEIEGVLDIEENQKNY